MVVESYFASLVRVTLCSAEIMARTYPSSENMHAPGFVSQAERHGMWYVDSLLGHRPSTASCEILNATHTVRPALRTSFALLTLERVLG